MKIIKIFLFIISIAFSLNVNAQITKEYWLIGGNASFSYSKSKSDIGGETFTMDISPNVGYFFFDKIALGAKVDYTVSQSKFDTGISKFDRLLISPFARYYFLETNKPINFFLETGYEFAVLNEDNFTQLSVKGGAAIFLNRSVAFEIILEYLNSNTTNVYQGSNTILIGFGIQVHLRKEKII